jgi:hypothetical protein
MGPSSNRQGIGTLIFILVGPIVWAVHLTLIYGSQSSLCAFNLNEDRGESSAVVAIILLVTALSIAVVGFSAVRPNFIHALIARGMSPTEQAKFIVTIMRVLSGLSILAMFYAGLSAVFLPACEPLR